MSVMQRIACSLALLSLIPGAVANADVIAGNQTTGWDATAREKQTALDRDFAYHCPANGRVTDVWGTDTYTDDSSVCSAAVHAGLITAEQGGTVTIRIKPGQAFYEGSDRNGVSSQDYGPWDRSFIFIK